VEDADGIVRLFSEGGNPHGWSLQKWQHYYTNYPEGETVFFVAEADQGIIGHYGLFPVMIGGNQVYMGAHAYVTESVRGLAVVSRLMKSLDEYCIDNGIPFIVGFANHKFTTVKTKLFRWKTPFFASFVSTYRFDFEEFEDRPFRFQYSDKWLRWRFGDATDPAISKYQNASTNTPVYQLLHTESKVTAEAHGLSEFECWSPHGYEEEPNDKSFSQPFSVKVYDKQWVGPDLLNPENWLIQMGDSDTFVFKAT
jgi:hypothetical protein